MSLVDLGRRRRHDPANRRHQTPHRKPTRGLSVRHPLRARHADQFYLGACVGGSGNNLQNCSIAWRSRQVFNSRVHANFTRRYLPNDDLIRQYHEATVRDPWPGEYPPDDTGSSALGLMQWWREFGIVSDFDWVISGGMDPLIASIQHTPVLFGSYWFDDMMYTNPTGFEGAEVTSECEGVFGLDDAGGHEYLCNAVIWRGGRWWFGHEQSWGEDPPDFEPTFYMRDDLVEHLVFGLAGDVAVPKLLGV